jgi:cyclopropane-fatty-acyl-phospholipid synthase
MVVEDVHNFGAHYDPTLMAWHERFERGWEGLRERYGERFRRMWRLYLLMCAGAFRSRRYQVFQMVLSPRGVPGGYRPVRSVGPGEGAARPATAGAAARIRG